MPEFPPVTMNTLPLSLGSVSGWKVMLNWAPKLSLEGASKFDGE